MSSEARADRFAADREIEGRYSFHRDPQDYGISVLAYVSVHAEELAQEFFEWWAGSVLPIGEALIKWEQQRFGAALYTSAHGVLWFVIRPQIKRERTT